MNTCLSIFSNFQLHLQHLLNRVSTKQEVRAREPLKQQHDIKLSAREINMVMDRLGMLDYECDRVQECWGAIEVWKLFEEEEPSLEEVKEAFDVFDKNKDGFIDAEELQRVLCSLGLKQGSEVEKCKRMIRAADENGDGVIDFDEFVKTMEMCF